ncbi:MAG: SDR family NAD(P)-dependent oxidoreductase [Caldilineaceae bacterium]|nr:SDR family NAD(P)-dependent oxidoreductase [Caldilineaceae bacterium]
MQIFLTGGTGFIGQPLTQSLIARGWDVVALVRKPDSPQALALTQMGARCVAGDVTERESMRAGMTGADMVVHNAGWYEIGVHQNARKTMHAINVTGTENTLGLALELGVERAVYVSSTIVFGATGEQPRDESFRRQTPYRSYYEQSKTEAHEIAQGFQERGLPLVTLCPAHVVGPNDHSVWGYFLRMYLNRLMPPFAWAPETVNSAVHVNDVAAGLPWPRRRAATAKCITWRETP